jgi:hypothetical protein
MKSLAKLLIFVVFAAGIAGAAEHSPTLDELIVSTPQGQPIPLVLFLDNRLTMDDIYPTAVTLPMEARSKYVVGRLQTRFNDMGSRVMQRLEEAKKDGQVTILRPLWILNGVRVWATAEIIKDLDANYPEVNYIVADPPHYNTLDLEGAGVADMQAPRVWAELGTDGSGVIVAHKDAGLDIFQPGFQGHLWINPGEDIDHDGAITAADSNGVDDDGDGYVDDFWGWGFDNDNNDVRDNPDAGNNYGHGTKTASVVSANFTPCDTISVAPGAKLMELSAFITQGAVWEASQYAIMKGIHVMTASLSYQQVDCQDPPQGAYDCPNRVAHRFVSEMELAAGLIHANSTGNAGLSNQVPLSMNAPADCPPPAMTAAHGIHGGVSSIVSVEACTAGGSYSSGGIGPSVWTREGMCVHPRMAFCGPEGHGNAYPYSDYPYDGVTLHGLFKPDLSALTGVRSLWIDDPNNPCSTIGGTSGATPHVGGALALIFAKFPGITPEAAYLLLVTTAEDIGITGPDTVLGFGKVKPYPAILAGVAQMTLLTGIVSGPDGPVADVLVSTDSAEATYSGPSGTYNIWLRPGQHTVVFEKFGLADTPITVTASGGTMTQNVTMAAGVQAQVVLTAMINGTPQSQVPVYIPKIPLNGITGDVTGTLTVDLYAGRYQIIYGSLPWQRDTLILDVPPGNSSATLNLVISPRTYPTGPDGNGYRIYDILDAPSVTYDWMEINPDLGGLPGALLDVGDDGTVVQNLPFTFRYWGTNYSQITVSANGFIIMGSSSSQEWSPQPLPSTQAPNNIICPLFQDWQPADYGGQVFAYADAAQGRMIVEWYHVTDYDSTGFATFEAILYDPSFTPFNTDEGVIKLQYNSIHGRNPGTVGEENSTGTDGLQYLYQLQYDPNALPLSAARAMIITTDSSLDVNPSSPTALPKEFTLYQNYPNPFNPTTTFSWSVPHTAEVRLSLYDVLGREAAVVFDGTCTTGVHSQVFDATRLATGVYFARLESQGHFLSARKVLLLK